MHIVLNTELVRHPHTVPYPGVKRGSGVSYDMAALRAYVPLPFDPVLAFPGHAAHIQKLAKVHPEAPVVYCDYQLTQLDDLNQGFLGLVADCYSRHEKLCLQPQDLWYIVLNELAVEINSDPEKYRLLFTSSQEKGEITVETGEVEYLPVRSIVNALEKNMPGMKLEWIIPHLTTLTAAAETALLAAVCHMASPYYKYGTFMCGIPEIEVTGTSQDWDSVAQMASKLASLFSGDVLDEFEVLGMTESINRDLGRYFDAVAEVLWKISRQVGQIGLADAEPDVDFWQSIFTTGNVGSGRQLTISGWIKDFYFKKRPDDKLENFTSACSVVVYTNHTTQREFVAVHGAFGVNRSAEGFLSAEYGQIVFELTGLGERTESREEAEEREMKAIYAKLAAKRREAKTLVIQENAQAKSRIVNAPLNASGHYGVTDDSKIVD